ncbi:MAG: hypothetical protein ACF8GE_11855 [Phycisphaerales bacterium JB043]
MTMSPDSAARLARLSMAGLIGAGVVLAGAMLYPVDDSTPQPQPVDPTEFEQEGERVERQPVLPMPWTRLVSMLDDIHEPAAEDVRAQNDSGQQGTGAPQPTPTTAAQSKIRGWKYIGNILINDTHYAVVTINNKQHFLAAGDSIQGVDVMEISEAALSLNVDSTTQTLDIRRRPAPRMTPAASSSGGTPMPGDPDRAGGMQDQRPDRGAQEGRR